MKPLVAFLLLAWSIVLSAKPVPSMDEIPVLPDASYVFFYHGAIAEGTAENPVSERHGEYDFTGLKQALDSDSYYLIANIREKGISVKAHAEELAGVVSELLDRGVAANNISLVGFSRGGSIVATAAGLIDNAEIRYVLLASCPKVSETVDWPAFRGRLLSMYEKDDSLAASCAFLTQGSAKVSEFKEIPLETGLGHGEFYRPQQRWIQPVRAWISNKD